MAQTLRALAALSDFGSQNPLLPVPAAPVALMSSDLRGVCVRTHFILHQGLLFLWRALLCVKWIVTKSTRVSVAVAVKFWNRASSIRFHE